MSTGLTIITERGTIEVPRSVEAEGGAAIEVFVAQQFDAITSAAPTPVTQSVTAASAPLEHSEE